MTPEQQKALALARARRRRQEAQAAGAPPQPQPQPQTESQQSIDGRKELSDLTQQASTPAHGGVTGAIDAFGRGLVDFPSFGFADEVGAGARWLGGKVLPWRSNVTYDEALEEVRGQDKAVAEAHPAASLAGQVTGAFALPMKAAGSTLGAVGQGMGVGAAYGFGSGEGGFKDRVKSAGVGSLMGGAAGGAVHSVFSKLASRAARASIPSAETIKQAGSAAYKAADDAGVAFTPGAVERLRADVIRKLTDDGYDSALQPGAGAVLRRLEELQGQNVTLKGLETVRKVAGGGFIPGNKSNNRAVGEIVDSIDNLVANPGADDVLMGNAQAGGEAMTTARELWSRSAKADRVSSAVERAKLQAGSTGSGGNVDNATRQKLRQLIANPRGFSAQEQAALRTAVTGTTTQNALRLAGKFAPTGVVSGVLSGGAGYGIAGPVGLALPLTGAAAKAIADNMTKKSVRELTEMILSGGKSADRIAKDAARGVGKEELVRRIMGMQEAESVLGPAASRVGVGLSEYMRR